MCDIFTREDARSLLEGKYILLLGDSNMRALYKDIIWLLEKNTLIDPLRLRTKQEKSYLGDKKIVGDKLHKARNYKETRVYENHNLCVKFHFLTKCYSDDVEEMLEDIKSGATYSPDIVVVNSCLWDISRWGPNGVPEYKDNMVKLMRLFKSCLSKETSVIWTTTLPISASCRGGFLIKQVEFLRHTLRFEVMEANMYARDVVASFGYDVLDVHYYLRMQIHRRSTDGIHWLPSAVRHINNLLLTHIALLWDRSLPGNFTSVALDKSKMLALKEKNCEMKLPQLPNIATGDKQSELVLSCQERRKKRSKRLAKNLSSPAPVVQTTYFHQNYSIPYSCNDFIIDSSLLNSNFPNLSQQFQAYYSTFGQNYTYANEPLHAVQKPSKKRRNKKRKCNGVY